MWSSVRRFTSRSCLLVGHADKVNCKIFQHQLRVVFFNPTTAPVIPLSKRTFTSFVNSSARPAPAPQNILRKTQWSSTVIKFSSKRYLTANQQSAVTGVHENISALQSKKRIVRRREATGTDGFKIVEGYTTAEEYNLEALLHALKKQDLYIAHRLSSDSQATNFPNDSTLDNLKDDLSRPDVLHAVAKYVVEEEPREIFFFREGCVVLWNIREEEIANIFAFLKPFEHNPYDERLVLAEKETMPYRYFESNRTKIQRGTVVLPTKPSLTLDKFAVSNAISSTLKLGIWEASLECYIDSIEFVTDDLKMGRKVRMTREEVLRKHGELFALRHLINLSSDLLDTPDFYWEHDDLEAVYQESVSYFNIGRRTRVMNEKLNHCVELVELISSHLNDKHHVRLEWMIIVLIMVEVVFEVLHFSERLLNRETNGSNGHPEHVNST